MLSVDGMDDLLVDKDLFTYVNDEGQVERHGTTMLYLIYDRVDPTTEVGMNVHLKKLERSKMGDHNNDVDVMLHYGGSLSNFASQRKGAQQLQAATFGRTPDRPQRHVQRIYSENGR